MTTEIKAPVFPESVAEGTVATWHKKPGEAIARDELIVDIETDKVVLEVVALADGVIESIIKGEGETVASGEVVGIFRAGGAATVAAATAPSAAAPGRPRCAGRWRPGSWNSCRWKSAATGRTESRIARRTPDFSTARREAPCRPP